MVEVKFIGGSKNGEMKDYEWPPNEVAFPLPPKGLSESFRKRLFDGNGVTQQEFNSEMGAAFDFEVERYRLEVCEDGGLVYMLLEGVM